MNLLYIILIIIGIMGLVLFFPWKGTGSFKYTSPTIRFHEADHVLSRRLLKPGSSNYDAYYSIHPEFQKADDRSRQAPGLLDRLAYHYDPGTFAAARSNFEIIGFMGQLTHATTSHSITTVPLPDQSTTDTDAPRRIHPEKTSRFITGWLKNTGAHSVGITTLRDYHLYSHKGRGPRSGEPIVKTDEYAVAITTEMDHQMMQSAPEGSSVMESSEQYLRSGVLALKLAAWIKELGYNATAHIDGDYEVICPLVATDAGLGVIGRMGLLMTPDLGPRVRISVVTTNMPLIASEQQPDPTVLHFCHHCEKCVQTCPAGAIPAGPRKEIAGVERWQVNAESCYHYWTVSGTDCGRCISVCPYSHPDTLFHRFIRFGIKNNLVFRYLAIKLDDVFYGRKPRIRPLPAWTDIMNDQ